jgi:hypothetical protein
MCGGRGSRALRQARPAAALSGAPPSGAGFVWPRLDEPLLDEDTRRLGGSQ